MVEGTAGEEIFKFRLTSVGKINQGISVWTRVKLRMDESLSLGWHQVVQVLSFNSRFLFKWKLLLDEPFRLATSRLVFFLITIQEFYFILFMLI